MAFAIVRISGRIPYPCHANIVPVRPIPHCTSSQIIRISFSSQILRMPSINSWPTGWIPPSPCKGSRMIPQVFSFTSAFTLSKSLYFAKRTPGSSGSKGSLYSGCPVTDTAPAVLPWKECSMAISSYLPDFLVQAYFLAAFNAPSIASAPLFVKNTLSIPEALANAFAAIPQFSW